MYESTDGLLQICFGHLSIWTQNQIKKAWNELLKTQDFEAFIEELINDPKVGKQSSQFFCSMLAESTQHPKWMVKKAQAYLNSQKVPDKKQQQKILNDATTQKIVEQKSTIQKFEAKTPIKKEQISQAKIRSTSIVMKEQKIQSSSSKKEKEKDEQCKKLQKIVKDISRIVTQNKGQQILHKIQEYAYDNLLSAEASLVKKQIQPIIRECFKMDIGMGRINKDDIQDAQIQYGVLKWKKYSEFSTEMGKKKEINLFDYFSELANEYKNSFLWTDLQERGFVQILFSLIKENDIRAKLLANIFEKNRPNLICWMYTKSPKRTLLWIILNQTAKIPQRYRKPILEQIRKMIINQNVDLSTKGNQQMQDTYQQQLEKIMSNRELKNYLGNYLVEQRPKTQYQFLCVNLEQKYIRKIPIPDETQEKVEKFLGDTKEMEYKVSDEKCQLQLRCGEEETQVKVILEHENLEGFLVSSKILRKGQYFWKILDTDSWKIISMDQKQSAKLDKDIKSETAFTTLRDLNLRLQIDTNNLKVKLRKNIDVSSKIQESSGIIFQIPNRCMTDQFQDISDENQFNIEEQSLVQSCVSKNFFDSHPQNKRVSGTYEYPHLGRLMKFIATPSDVQIILKNDKSTVKVEGLKGKQYINQWIRNDRIAFFKNCFNQSSDKQQSCTVQISGPSDLIPKFTKQLKQLVQSHNLNADLKLKNQKLVIGNVKSEEKQYVVQFCEYQMKMMEGQQKLTAKKIQVGRQNAAFIKKIQQEQQKNYYDIFPLAPSKDDKQNNGQTQPTEISVIQENYSQTKQLLDFKQNDEISIEMQEVAALKMAESAEMKMSNVKIRKLNPQYFQVSGKQKDVYEFQRNLIPFIKLSIEKKMESTKVQLPIPGACADYKVYQSVLSLIEDTEVNIQGSDLIVVTTKKQYANVLNKIHNEIQEKLIRCQELTPEKFEFNGIKYTLADSVLRRLTKEILKIKGKNNQTPSVEMQGKQNEQSGFIFSLITANQQQKKQFQRVKQLIFQRFFEYNSLWKGLRKTNELVNSHLLPFRQVENTERDIKNELKILIKQYSQHLNQQINQIVKEEQRIVTNTFRKFIQDGNIQAKFNWKPQQSMNQSLRKKNQGIFSKYLNDQIEKAKQQNVLKGKFEERLKIIKDIVEKKVEQFDLALIKGQDIAENIVPLITTIKTVVSLFLASNLPIVQHLHKFRDLIQSYQTVIVKTGTGSGKSSLLPPFLIALGYKRVVVTQPRRLPCRTLYERVCDTFFRSLVGYSYSGQSINAHHPLHYTTDGLIKELLQRHPQMIKKIDVLMLDEIHERSKNIDLILLNIKKLRQINPKLKVILCSATVDQSIVSIFEGKNNFGTFKVDVQTYPVKETKIQGLSAVQLASKLGGKLFKNDKMLVFFSGVNQVRKNVQLFINRYNKQALPLLGDQSAKQQDSFLEKGQIFFATSIAETSLTFPGLKYVIDTRKSRTTVYNEKTGLMELRQFAVSKSSAAQRKGRVGRDCPGEYYYEDNIENHMTIGLHTVTEIERMDISRLLFQLLQYEQFNTFDKSVNAIKVLFPDQRSQNDILRKIQVAKKKLMYFNVLDQQLMVTRFCKQSLFSFGAIGPIQFNYALSQGVAGGCSYQMIAIISFLMIGTNVVGPVLESIPSKYQHKSGDIMTVANYLIKIGESINLMSINENEIHFQLRNQLQIRNKPWFPTMVRVLKQMKKFMTRVDDVCSCKDWSIVQRCLVSKAFRNYIYFNEQMLGGRKNNYEKLLHEKMYCFDESDKDKIWYRLGKSSLSEKQNHQVILSLSAFCDVLGNGILSFCSEIDKNSIKTMIKVKCIGHQNNGLNNVISQRDVLSKVVDNKESYNWPVLVLSGQFANLVNTCYHLQKDRRNKEYVFELSKQLEKRLQNKSQLKKQRLKRFFATINFKNIFSSWKYQCLNIYNTKTEFQEKKEKKIKLKSVKIRTIQMISEKIKGFFDWFVNCQYLCIEDIKQPVRQLKKKQKKGQISPIKPIEERINMIVDSSIQHHVIKNWANSKNNKFSIRTMRMVAVAWILVNKFYCTIKGGFIRDWVIRGEEKLPRNVDLSNILKLNPHTGFYQVEDQTIVPSDIDVELPMDKEWFDCNFFQNEMKSLGIKVEIKEDGWRRHITFDNQRPTGGFTVDLIQPYCYISHDQVDFDVNAFYVQKDHLGGLGTKLPMNLRPLNSNNCQQSHISLQNLVLSCLNNNMRQLKQDIYLERIEKFKKRGWTIDPIAYEPTVYKNYQTTQYKIYLKQFNEYCPVFKQQFPNANIVQVSILKNFGWEMCYDAARQWIRKEKQQTKQRLLFHGTSLQGAEGIFKSGFDIRYTGRNGQFFGVGTYFADDPKLSHTYTSPDAKNYRYMFVCWVALGLQEIMTKSDDKKIGPAPGYHSILATKPGSSQFEYIINRQGQARPLYFIKYTHP